MVRVRLGLGLGLELVLWLWLGSVPDLGLWRPLGNNIREKTSTPWPNTFNDCNK